MPFDFNRDVRSPQVGAELARAVSMLDQGDPAIAVRNIPELFGGYTGMYWREEDALMPRIMHVIFPGIDLLLLRGVKRQDTSRILALSFLQVPRIAQGGVNNQIFDAANFITGRDTPGWLGVWQQTVWIAGHSYGGAIGQVVAYHLRNKRVGPIPEVRCVTFGSPRTGNDTWRTLGRGWPNARWFNDIDPVRHMPPHANEEPLMHGALPAAQSALLNNVDHLSQGLCLRDSGVVEVRPDTDDDRPIGLVNLATWASGVLAQGRLPHSITEYERRLLLAATMAQPVPPRGPVNAVPAAQVLPVPPRQDAPVVQQAMDAALVSIHARLDMPPMARGIMRFRIARRGRAWVVTFNRETVVLAAGKVAARSIARRANQMLRGIDPSNISDINRVVEAVGLMV